MSALKKLAFLFIITGYSSGSYTQVLNIERLRLEKDTVSHFKTKVTAGINIYNRSAAADAPVNLFGYNLDLNSIYFPKDHALLFITNFDYLKINDDDFLNFGFIHFRVNWNRKKRLNFETYTQYSYDNFRGLHPRWVMGGGMRYKIIQNKKITLLGGIGALFEMERWEHPHFEGAVKSHLWKNSNYLSFRWTINQFADLNTVNYFQTGYDNVIRKFRNRLNSSTILNTKLSSKLSLKNSLELSYEDRPIVPITRTVFTFKTGLSLDF